MGINLDYKVKNLKTSDGLFVDVFDGVFTYQEQEHFEFFMSTSQYSYRESIGSHITSHLPWTYLHKRLSAEECQLFGIFKNEKVSSIISEYNLKIAITSWFNLSLPYTQSQIHTDKQFGINDVVTVSLMYYATNTWKENYGGETFFYNNKLEKELVIDYIPGRLILFDSKIPHKPAFSFGHVVGRYVFVSMLQKDENESNHSGW
jgi:Rps23 Pro-64 3,4-dihydroxylase Tpa1-like proline 4-hydroxylase